MKRIYILLLIFFVLLVSYLKNPPVIEGDKPDETETFAKNSARYEKIDSNLKEYKSIKEIKINPTEEYNYLKKEDIYRIRKKYVKNSLFYTDDYEPSNEVFGQIEDNKPWYGLKYYNCATNVQGTNDVTLGDSEESRFVNNPDILVGINTWAYKVDDNYRKNPFCTETKYSKILKQAVYKPDVNTIVATYKSPYGSYYNLTGINARDFGYNYVYAENIENVTFLEKANITNGVYKFQDFIHTGGSCGLQGGCNNCSPNQPYLDFKLDNNIKAKMKLKLWRKQPKTPFDKPDIYFVIVFYT